MNLDKSRNDDFFITARFHFTLILFCFFQITIRIIYHSFSAFHDFSEACDYRNIISLVYSMYINEQND